MMHIQKVEKPYIIVRTKVDADVQGDARKMNEKKMRENIDRVQTDFMDSVKDLQRKSVYFTGKPISGAYFDAPSELGAPPQNRDFSVLPMTFQNYFLR